MAEVPLPTPTKVPVPSTDIRNAVFAGAKLDEEVTGTGDFYTDRLDVKRLTNTGRNNQFNAAQQERADQFQQFLLSSGYVFLGDYEDGPFQFSARNQYIRYDNQYYRLNATTDVGFTTTGTDATSFANDVTHFVLMDGDTLRQNLGSGDGLKWVGKCATLSALRTVEPTYSGQSITLRHAVSGGHEINCSLWYDADDLTTADDGYSVFVTAGGARWKADVSRGIDIRLAGLLADNSNLGTVLNAVINGEANKIKAAGTIKGAITNIFIPASRTVYKVDEPVFIPSFMCLNTDGYVYLYYPFTTGSAFSINNKQLEILSGSMPSNPADVQGCKIFNARGGRFILSGPVGDVSTGTGLYVGDPNDSVFAVRDLMACDLTILGFKYGIQITARNNFINTFYGIISMLNQYGVYVSGGQALNAGEKMIFEKCTIGNNSVAHFWFQAPMWYYINNCSLDYTSADVFLVGNLSQVSRILVQGGHIEGVPGYLVNCPAAPGIPVKVQFRDTQLYMNGANNSMRQLIHAPGGACAVSFEECDWTFTEYFETSQYISLSGYSDGTEANNRCVITNKSPRVTGLRSSQILPRYNNGLMGWRFNFVGTEGASILNLTDANTKITVSSANTDVSAKYGVATSDGARTIEITAAAATDVVELLLTPYYPAKARPAWCGGASVNIAGVTAGECDMYLVARTYEEPTLSFNSGTSTITTNRATVTNYISDVINVSEIFSKAGTPLTAADYVGVWQSVSQAQYADSCRLALRFTGFVGTVKVKLPVFWQASVL
ncbi:TPA: hypothetical protein RFC48_000029 [Klebsiella pneumoniae]|uniref:hypothetical protein n=1 Tax=Klebsiella pneumoniae TaxID=573 RepID=UPI0020A57AB6|nr:hypothetical protein [Klebsiella pneumoniae]ELA2040174.1 hypothetical protein [Klebsiella pneumoniae]WLY15563.1 hypothetical protein RA188_18610 [Klebsiella pneumoniae]HDK7013430.1 hypothetical protein [Klebsiella pneumoniae]HDU2744741.1 hypothetical protein [Klebsiella pneumoniae]